MKKINVFDVDEWNELVQKTYQRPYNFQQQDGCKDRGTFYFNIPIEGTEDYGDDIEDSIDTDEMGVAFDIWLARDPKQPLKDQKYDFDLRLWWERNFYPDVSMIIADLEGKGILEPGEYMIDIGW